VPINRWWDSQPDRERLWLETTDRSDFGVDLNAPQQDDSGRDRWSYSLINEIGDGDVVFHYHSPQRAIVAWSRAVGGVWDDEVTWAAHGRSAREHGVVPYRRPGWRLGLDGPFPLSRPVTTDELAANQDSLRLVRGRLQSAHAGTLYFPFEISDLRPPRAGQAYLTKFPSALIDLFPTLREANAAQENREVASEPAPEPNETIGATYRPADEAAATALRDPFSVDPAIVDRGVQGHARTQNALAAHLRALGWEPRSPRPGEPQFDLAWGAGEVGFVAEVKSITARNQEQQMRLGLGQVLRYRQLLAARGKRISAVLVIEHAPADRSWVELCRTLGVMLTWPADFGDRLRGP
jgi:hypothetical protein